MGKSVIKRFQKVDFACFFQMFLKSMLPVLIGVGEREEVPV